jgi:osmotically-inducible protein OsmY
MRPLIIFMAALGLSVVAQQQPPASTRPDNTKVNQRDRTESSVTADKQGNSKADVDRTAAIRKAITGQKSLSTTAHNAKVITLDGRVTLRGPVRDQSEKDMIGKLAADVAGVQNVQNELEVAPKK